MKKTILVLLMAVVSLGAKAQFEAGTQYISASLTGLSLTFNSQDKVSLGLNGTYGYFVEDAWMVYGQLAYNHKRYDDRFALGAGGRYYIQQNGLYMGLGLKYQYCNVKNAPLLHRVNNIYLAPEVGYCFYLNQYVSIEPAVYYDCSMNHFSDFSTIGLKLGFGYYF